MKHQNYSYYCSKCNKLWRSHSKEEKDKCRTLPVCKKVKKIGTQKQYDQFSDHIIKEDL